MAYLELENVTKDFGAFRALKGISLSVEEGEFVSILGGSGCGKTTTLRIVAGFERASSGSVLLGGQDLSPIPPEKRELGFVFQHYALFPNMNVRRNISFGLKGMGLSRAETDKRVDDLLVLVRMEEFGHRYPRELSGGQQQRVALARALARRPKVLLLDEPLSALDAKIRVHLRGELRAIQRDLGVTTLYVTHDQEEALSLSDRVVLMKDGAIEQIGTPHELYNRPATEYAASFIGTANSLEARLVDPARGEVSIGEGTVKLGRPLPGPAGRPLRLLLRPESLAFSADSVGEGRAVLPGRLVDLRFLGAVVRSVVELDGAGGTVLVDSFNEAAVDPPRIGAAVAVGFDPERCAVY